MAFKRIGGWIVKDKIFAQVKIANELWSFGKDKPAKEDGEYQVQFFHIGYYSKPQYNSKIWSITILWILIQIGFKTSFKKWLKMSASWVMSSKQSAKTILQESTTVASVTKFRDNISIIYSESINHWTVKQCIKMCNDRIAELESV